MAEIVARGLAEKAEGRAQRSRQQLQRLKPEQLEEAAKRLHIQTARSTKLALITALAPVLGPRWWKLREAINEAEKEGPASIANWLGTLKARPGNYEQPLDEEH